MCDGSCVQAPALAVWCKVWPCPDGPLLVLSMWRSAWGFNAQLHQTWDMHAQLRRTSLLVLGQALHEHQNGTPDLS